MLSILIIAALALASDHVILEERIDLFDPSTGSYLGSERTWFGPAGQRLRLEATDAEGKPTLLFFIRHDGQGRETEAIYFEDGSEEPSREEFTYSREGRLKTTTYFYQAGVAADRTEVDLDRAGRETRKRYYRADGSQYGEEAVLWNEDGSQRGWDFRYLGREGGASFRYAYDAFDVKGEWVRRTRIRDGKAERTEVRSRTSAVSLPTFPATVPFAPNRVSTDESEASPSFSRDGKTMVFARYGEDWTRKEPFIAHLQEDGWRVEPLAGIGPVYNLALSPDAETVIYATRSEEARTLFRIRRTEAGWSAPENLSARYGLTGTYPCLTDNGTLFFFDVEGASGAGIYSAAPEGEGFGRAQAVYVAEPGSPFDAYTDGLGSLLVTRCFDDGCLSGSRNGIWEVRLDPGGEPAARKLPNLPYAWGAQPVEALGLFIFTDGDDILAIPLSVAGVDR